MTRNHMPPHSNDHTRWADGWRMGMPLTEQSAPGTYIVITASRTKYHVQIADDVPFWTVTRYPRERFLLLDAEPLTGVLRFFVDAEGGLGQIEWWKENIADRDDPDRAYADTVRTTSRVMPILSLNATAGEAQTIRLLLDGLRSALEAVDSDDEFIDLLTFLVRHGHGGHDR